MHGYMNVKVPWRVCRGPPQVITPCQINPINNIPCHFLKGSVNVIQLGPPATSPILLRKKTTNYEALHIISLLSVIHNIYSIMQTKIQGLHVSTVYGQLQAIFLN